MADNKNKTGNSHAGHRKRVWQELTKVGISEHTPPHKVLELMLFFTIPRKDTNELAHTLLNHFGNSFANVMEASIEQLKEVPGITEYTASHIKLILDFTKYYEMDKVNKKSVLFDRRSGAEFLAKKFMGVTVEESYLLCLDNTFKYLGCSKLSSGDEMSVALSPRTVVEHVTKMGATKVILAHNHPRGFAVPSEADIVMTTNIATLLSTLDVTLLDHIIVAEGDFVSLRDSEKYSYIFKL